MPRKILFSSITIVLTTGSKGPIGLVLLFAYFIVFVWLFINKKYGLSLKCGIMWFLSFLLTYLLFINYKGVVSSHNGLKILGFIQSIKKSPYTMEIYHSITFCTNKVIKTLLTVIIYLLKINYSISIFGILGIAISVTEYIKTKRITIYNCILVSICVFGTIMTLITNQYGGSQIYFLTSIFPFSLLLGGSILEKKHKVARYVSPILVISICASLYVFINGVFIPSLRDAYNIYNKNINELESYNYIYADEHDWEMCEWLKCNTNSDSVVAINDINRDSSKSTEMIFGVLSERYIWNDGKYSVDENEVERRNALIKEIVSGKDSFTNKLKEEEVDYLVVQQNDVDYISNSEFIKKYENPKYIVYSLNR